VATTAINTENPTLLDLIRLRDPNGAQAKVVEALQKRTPLLQVLTFQEGNMEGGHKFSTRTGLPSIGWRMFNQGVAAGKSRADQITETCGMLEGRSVVDCELANYYSDKAAFRASEDMAFTQAFRHEVETGLFYHSTKTSPEKFMGLSPRLDLTTGPYGSQIISSSISHSGSDQTSVWLIAFSPDTVFGITPKGQPSGLVPHDMGELMVEDENGNEFRAYTTVWNWKIGLCVKDARYVVRIANIDTGAIVGTGHLLLDDMVDAYHQLQDRETGRLAWFTNRTIGKWLHKQAMDRVASSSLSIDGDLSNGKPITRFMGIPIYETDALLSTEAVVS
jgi:hypothetical protein